MHSSLSTNICYLLGDWTGEITGTDIAFIFGSWKQVDKLNILEIRVKSSEGQIILFQGESNIFSLTARSSMAIKLYEIEEGRKTSLEANLVFIALNENILGGDWELSDKGKGKIRLERHNGAEVEINNLEKPVQNVGYQFQFKSLSIYKPDIEKIIKIMQDLTSFDGYVLIEEEVKEGKQFRNLAKDYLMKEKRSDRLLGLNITAQRKINGYLNTIILNLKTQEPSNLLINTMISSQNTNPAWFYYGALDIKAILDQKRNKFAGFFKQEGLGINLFLFLGLIIFLPEEPDWQNRVWWVIAFLIFGLSYAFFHRKVPLSYIDQRNEHIPYIVKLLRNPIISYLVSKIIDMILPGVITTVVTGAGYFLWSNFWKVIDWLGF